MANGIPYITPPLSENQISSRIKSLIEFEVEEMDYSVAEFHDIFAHKLPLFVMVNQGFCGDIIQDTFDKKQILRLHTVSRQKRVIAKSQYEGQLKMCSIPLTYMEPLCVLNKKHKPGKEELISSIIKDHKLPVKVQFPRDRFISVGSQTISTNRIPPMELTECFDEMYILGNLISDGALYLDVIEVPLYLSKLRLSVCTGIKGRPQEKWAEYQEELNQTCSRIEYDPEYGNSNIAVYHPETIHSDTVYSYIEPTQYSSFFQMFKSSVDVPQEIDENFYEMIETRSSTVMDTDRKNTTDAQRPLSSTSVFKKMERTFRPPPRHPKPKILNQEFEKSFEKPAVPDRKRKVKEAPQKQETPNIYLNVIPRGPVTPMKTEEADVSVTAADDEGATQSLPLNEENTKGKPFTIAEVKELKDSDDVAKLSIDEISEYLRKLKLEKYVQLFEDNLVDGTILCELDKGILQDTFGLNVIEAIRLMKFIRCGHIPT